MLNQLPFPLILPATPCYLIPPAVSLHSPPLHHMFQFSLPVFSLLKFSPLISSHFSYLTIQGRGPCLAGECCNRYVLDLHNILDYTYIHYRSNKQNKQEFKQTYYHNNNKNKQNNTKCPN